MQKQQRFQVSDVLRETILAFSMRGKDYIAEGILRSQAQDEVELEEAVKFADAEGLRVTRGGVTLKVH